MNASKSDEAIEEFKKGIAADPNYARIVFLSRIHAGREVDCSSELAR